MIQKQQLLSCIHDDSYRAWLNSHMELISDVDWIALVQKSDMPLHIKIDLLSEMLADKEWFPEPDMREDLQSVLTAMKEALQLTKTVSADTLFLLRERWFDRDEGVLTYREHGVCQQSELRARLRYVCRSR